MRENNNPAVYDDSTDASTSSDDVKAPETEKTMKAVADSAIGGGDGSGTDDQHNP